MSHNREEIFHLHFLSSISEIDADEWDSLAGSDYPFMQHAFFLALENSNSACATTGWQPYHVVIKKECLIESKTIEQTVAIMPLFLKDNSSGEYVFDWSWADAYQRHGMDYYPKFVSAIPFTPCPGPRVCIAKDQDTDEIHRLLCRTIPEQAMKLGVSSWHILFPEKSECEALAKHGIQQRIGCQYQWFNKGYENFNNFLEHFSSRKRKNIRKERKKIIDADIEFEFIEGSAIQPSHWKEFYLFYQSTYFVRGRAPYLTPDFFTEVGKTMPANLLLVMAKKEGKYIAGALSFIGADTLYGRYWGCIEEYQFLHFETCYYQGIDYCIEKELLRFDSGAQGEHKIQRGFEPVFTWSNHWIAHQEFDQAISRFLKDEEKYIRRYQTEATNYLPFKDDLNIEKQKEKKS